MRENSWKFKLVTIALKILWTAIVIICLSNRWFLDLQITTDAKQVIICFVIIYAIFEAVYIILLIVRTDWPKREKKPEPIDDTDEKVKAFLAKYKVVDVDEYAKRISDDQPNSSVDAAAKSTVESQQNKSQ